MIKKTPARKRKRAIRRIIVLGSICLAVTVVLGGIGYYLIAVTFKKPLFISPLSRHQSASGFADKTAHGSSGHANIQGVESGDDFEEGLKRSFKEKNIAFSSLIASDSAYIVKLNDNGTVTFSSEKDLQSQISSLQFILSRLTMEGRKIRSLDLRFDKPVIIFDK